MTKNVTAETYTDSRPAGLFPAGCTCCDYRYFYERKPRPLCPVHRVHDKTHDEILAEVRAEIDAHPEDFSILAKLAKAHGLPTDRYKVEHDDEEPEPEHMPGTFAVKQGPRTVAPASRIGHQERAGGSGLPAQHAYVLKLIRQAGPCVLSGGKPEGGLTSYEIKAAVDAKAKKPLLINTLSGILTALVKSHLVARVEGPPELSMRRNERGRLCHIHVAAEHFEGD